MSRVNNGAGRRPGGANRYYLSMEKKNIVENRTIEGTRHIVTSLLAMLEQDHGARWQPGQNCAVLGAALSWVSSGQEEALLFLLLGRGS